MKGKKQSKETHKTKALVRKIETTKNTPKTVVEKPGFQIIARN